VRAAHTVEQVRSAEAELMAALPPGTLMQRAATGLASAVSAFLGRMYGARVLLLVGSGDNGGDALFAGALLARRGARVEAVLLASSGHPEGVATLRASGGRVVALADAHRPDVVLDGIVGIGGRPGLRPDAVAAVERFAGVPVVAVDVPSGVGVDTGELDGPHVRADLTVTFGTHKVCHLVDPAAHACGVVTLVDIGLGLPAPAVISLQESDVAALLPRPSGDDHKYTRGVLGIRTGSDDFPGAAVLGVGAAATGLCGMVRYSGPAARALRVAHPQVVVGEGRVQAWLVGSGGGEDAGAALSRALADDVPVVVDADALAAFPGGRADAVLTPHAGELASLLDVDRGLIEAQQLHHARLAADRFRCVVLLKGRHSLVAHPDGRVRVNTSGTPWLATAGTGDVLAGVVGALLAAGLTPYDAASVGAWLHGAAGVLASGGGPITPQSVADAVPAVVRRLSGDTD
jgi:hydroxyethylthiazole kinase-like uncharacterized protein yjeF